MATPQRYPDRLAGGWHLRIGREAANLKQAEIAALAGCHVNSIRYQERQSTEPCGEVVDSVLDVLRRHGVTLAVAWDGEHITAIVARRQ
jgi:hypothetical protein